MAALSFIFGLLGWAGGIWLNWITVGFFGIISGLVAVLTGRIAIKKDKLKITSFLGITLGLSCFIYSIVFAVTFFGASTGLGGE